MRLYYPTPPRGLSTLKWKPFPEAAGYSVQVWRPAPNYIGVFRQPRVDGTSIQVDVYMPPGEYLWRVDAINRAGHTIGCNYPIRFRIATN